MKLYVWVVAAVAGIVTAYASSGPNHDAPSRTSSYVATADYVAKADAAREAARYMDGFKAKVADSVSRSQTSVEEDVDERVIRDAEKQYRIADASGTSGSNLTLGAHV